MLPKEYGSSSTCHRRFQEWRQSGIFDKLWTRLLKIYDNKRGIKWNWQSLDSISVKSPVGGAMTGHNPTDRSKLGTKRHILTDKDGIPLSAIKHLQILMMLLLQLIQLIVWFSKDHHPN